MPIIGNRQHDRIDVIPRHQLAIIVVGFAIGVAVMAVDLSEGLLQMILIQIAGGHDLAILLREKRGRVPGSLHSPSYHTQGDALRRRSSPGFWAGAGRQNSGGREGESGGGDEAAPANAGLGGSLIHSSSITPDFSF